MKDNILFSATVETPAKATTASERMQAWYQNHLESLDPNQPEMTLDEINEEIRLARAERKARLAK